jgi:hypothetical protein
MAADGIKIAAAPGTMASATSDFPSSRREDDVKVMFMHPKVVVKNEIVLTNVTEQKARQVQPEKRNNLVWK